MRLKDAVSNYVEAKRVSGLPFHSSEVTLRAFCKHCGDIRLHEVTSALVSTFSNRPKLLASTRVSKFSGVKCFVEYCIARGLIRPLILHRPARPHKTRDPFIYTKFELALLMKWTEPCQAKTTELDARTFRLLLLLLYTTGATVQEVLGLRWPSVNLRKKLIVFDKTVSKPSRSLPISKSLADVLARNRIEGKITGQSDFVLRGTDGEPIDKANLKERFVRLRKLAGIRKSVDGRVPRLQDFRFTFAVHRLNSWIRQGDDLNKLIPALSTYMGYSSPTAAERFLAYVPSRFRRDLEKLSPAKGRKPWSKDKELMAFLASL